MESVARETPPDGLPRPLEAVWQAAKGDWSAAHGLVQMAEGEASHDWVHACLHRIEGDLDNARYWYRRAGRPVFDGPVEHELEAIAEALLAGEGIDEGLS